LQTKRLAGFIFSLCSLALIPASRPQQRGDQIITEKKAKYIPAGPGQRPFDVTRHVIPLDDIESGGPWRDGIPALDHPVFLKAQNADRSLKSEDMVLGVEFGSIAKAYPVRILTWHEVVNDDVGEQPILISWCPLCGSGLVYDPRLDGRRFTFGVSGLLYKQNLLFFDRETDTLWSQIKGQAVTGPLAGSSLRLLPVAMTTWGSWKTEHPETVVLSFQTGYKRDYGLDPYREFPIDHHMAFVVEIGTESRIYPFAELKKAGSTVHAELGDHTFTILFDAKKQIATVKVSSGDPPPHFVAFLGYLRPFFPNASVYQAR
jgi:hypothetical protein